MSTLNKILILLLAIITFGCSIETDSHSNSNNIELKINRMSSSLYKSLSGSNSRAYRFMDKITLMAFQGEATEPIFEQTYNLVEDNTVSFYLDAGDYTLKAEGFNSVNDPENPVVQGETNITIYQNSDIYPTIVLKPVSPEVIDESTVITLENFKHTVLTYDDYWEYDQSSSSRFLPENIVILEQGTEHWYKISSSQFGTMFEVITDSMTYTPAILTLYDEYGYEIDSTNHISNKFRASIDPAKEYFLSVIPYKAVYRDREIFQETISFIFEPDETVYVLGYGTEDNLEGQAFIHNIETFMHNNPEIPVVWDLSYDSQYFQDLSDRLYNKDSVHVIYTWGIGNQSEIVMDAGEAIDQIDFINPAEFEAGSMVGTGATGELYTISTGKEIHTVFYSNDALLTELGLTPATTYAELLTQKTTAEDAGKYLISYPGFDNWTNNTFLYSMIVGRFGGLQYTYDLIDGTESFNTVDSASVKALTFIETMFTDGVFSADFLSHNYQAALDNFNAGNALYLLDGGWRAANIELASFSWNNFPAITDEVYVGSANGGYSPGYAITKTASENTIVRSNAIAVLNYLVGEEASIVRAETMGTIPVYLTDAEIAYPEGTEEKATYFDSIDPLTLTVGDFTPSSVTTTMVESIDSIFKGTMTPAEAADAIETSATSVAIQ